MIPIKKKIEYFKKKIRFHDNKFFIKNFERIPLFCFNFKNLKFFF
jgi:hypothetical protein